MMPLSKRPRRYPSDTTVAEWAVLEPLFPIPACQTPTGGRPEKYHRRDVVDAIRYVVAQGCTWRALPADFPPWATIYACFRRWARAGVVTAIRDQLRARIRTRAGYSPGAVTVIIDSQSVKASETVSKQTRGWDHPKRINGRKRHLVVDSGGLQVMVMVTPADHSDRNVAREVLFRLRVTHPEITIVWADSAYAGGLVDWARTFLNLTVKTVSRPKDAQGFVVLPRRWVVERSNSWVLRARRNIRDHERLPHVSEAMIAWSAVIQMGRRLARPRTAASSWTTTAKTAA
jgi:transposase